MTDKETKKDWPLKGRTLRRSKNDRFVAGVCGGLGEYFEIDPLIFRLIFVLLTIFAGSGIIIYIIFWILMPEEGEKRAENLGDNIKEGAGKMADEIKEKAGKIDDKERDKKGRIIGGLLILTIGMIFLSENVFPHYGFGFAKLWPLILIVIGISVMIGSDKK